MYYMVSLTDKNCITPCNAIQIYILHGLIDRRDQCITPCNAHQSMHYGVSKADETTVSSHVMNISLCIIWSHRQMRPLHHLM